MCIRDRLSFVDVLRTIISNTDWQIFISTHEERFYEIMKVKLNPQYYNSKFLKFKEEGIIVEDTEWQEWMYYVDNYGLFIKKLKDFCLEDNKNKLEIGRIYLLIRLSTFGGATPLRKSKQIFIAREKLTWYSYLRFLLFTGTCKIIMEQKLYKMSLLHSSNATYSVFLAVSYTHLTLPTIA